MTEPTPLPNAAVPLTELATKIKTLHGQVIDAGKNVVERAVAAGSALIEAKRQVPHGGWLRWLDENCKLSDRTAEDYMTLARNKRKVDAIIATAANMTLTQVLRKIKGKPDKDQEGSISKYMKARATLIKKLNDLQADDVVDAAESTMAELQKVIAAVKQVPKAA
jgi:hypothetical protein